jgi:hypothetical protein
VSGLLPSRRGARLALVVAVAAAIVVAVAASGGSGGGSSNGAPGGTVAGAGVAAGTGAASVAGGSAAASSAGAEAAPAPKEFIVASKDSVTQTGGTNEITAAVYPSGVDNDEISPTGATPIKPCGLVSKAQATTILGNGVKVSEAVQGPTCVYRAAGRQVTVVVEETPIKALREGARKAKKLQVAGRTGWCLTYESTSVVVPFDRRHTLQITGPCQAGVRFAAIALG